MPGELDLLPIVSFNDLDIFISNTLKISKGDYIYLALLYGQIFSHRPNSSTSSQELLPVSNQFMAAIHTNVSGWTDAVIDYEII